jgi:cell division topological specificity factor
VLALLQRLFNSKAESSSVAKNRLQFVLVQDRAGLSNEEIAKFKSELILVIEKYFEVDKTAFDISYRRDSDMTTLQINSPVLVKRNEKIRADTSAVAHSGMITNTDDEASFNQTPSASVR